MLPDRSPPGHLRGREVLGLWVAWAAGAAVLAPVTLWVLHRGTGIAALDKILSGRATIPLEAYLADWRTLALRLTIVLAAWTILWVARRPVAGATAWLLGRGRSVGAVDVLLLAFSLGMLSGVLEAAHVGIRHHFDPHPARGFTLELLWMAPAASGFTFLLLAALLLVLARLLLGPLGGWPRLPLALIVGGFGFLAAWGVLESPRWGLAGYSILLLAAGLGVHAARLAVRHTDVTLRLARVGGAVLGALAVGLLAAGASQHPDRLERRRLAALPPAPSGAPNVLLLILDTVRAASLGLYGYDRPTTPHLEAWARRGVVFERAMATSPWTLPTHASLFTGRLPHELTADREFPLDDRDSTLAEVLGARGYLTAGFVANMAYTTEASGLSRGFARYEDQPISTLQFVMSAAVPRKLGWRLLTTPWQVRRKVGARVTDTFLAWVDGASPRPFFAFLNYMDAHDPYLSPPEFRERFKADRSRIMLEKREGLTQDDLAGSRAAYDAAIAYLDSELARLFRALDRRGLTDRTIIIVTSDHGEFLGEHGLMLHGNALYQEVLHVPLVVVFPPRVPEATRLAPLVSLRDIPATILELALGEPSAPLPGRSLSRFWQGDAAAPAGAEPVLAHVTPGEFLEPWEPAAFHTLFAVFQDSLHLIRRSDGQTELYDFVRDPRAAHDLAASHPDAAQRLLQRLDSLRSNDRR